MRKVLLAFVVLVFVSCEKKEESHAFPRLSTKNTKNVVSVNSNAMLENDSRLLAVNFIGDTLVSYFKRNSKERLHFSGRPGMNLEDIVPRYFFNVFIDTSYAFAVKEYKYKRLLHWRDGDNQSFDKYLSDAEKLRKQYINSYPVLIFNDGLNPALFEDESNVPIIQEALDSDGKWKPIEFWIPTPMGCSTGEEVPIIFPNHYFATSIIRYEGGFKTKIRVKLRNFGQIFYSNEVIGYINKSQFNQDFLLAYLKEWRTLPEPYFEGQKELMFLNPVNPSYWNSKDQQ